MRIDLRYVIVVLAFYVPGIMMIVGRLGLGYSMDEMREGVAVGGTMLGASAVLGAISWLFSEHGPIWITLWRKRD